MKKFKSLIDQWPKLYFSFNGKPEIEILNGLHQLDTLYYSWGPCCNMVNVQISMQMKSHILLARPFISSNAHCIPSTLAPSSKTCSIFLGHYTYVVSIFIQYCYTYYTTSTSLVFFARVTTAIPVRKKMKVAGLLCKGPFIYDVIIYALRGIRK